MKRELFYLYIILPFILWPLTFVIFKQLFMFSMFISTLTLSLMTLIYFRDKFDLKTNIRSFLGGILSSLILYFVFYMGNIASKIVGLHFYVSEVYDMISTIKNPITLIFGLGMIGLFEEIYWRGGLQGVIADKYEHCWIYSTLLYTIVHISTLNPILVLAAFFVGLILGLTAYHFGLFASIISHIIWLEAIIVFFPLL